MDSIINYCYRQDCDTIADWEKDIAPFKKTVKKITVRVLTAWISNGVLRGIGYG